MNQVDQALAQFGPDDYTTKLCGTIFGSIPFAPQQPAYRTLDEAIRVLYPAATPQVVARTHEIANGDGVKSALWMCNMIDTGDTGIAVYSGVSSAVNFFFGDKSKAFETDTQQGVDSALKLLGLAYVVARLYPGSIPEKVGLYHTAPAGQGLSFYYAAVEVALPFADNVAAGGAGFLQQLMDRYGSDAQSKLAAVGGGAGAEAEQAVTGLLGPVSSVVTQVGPHAKMIAGTLQSYLPTVHTVADQVAGAVATAADALPVYRYMGARLAAESAVLLASRGQ